MRGPFGPALDRLDELSGGADERELRDLAETADLDVALRLKAYRAIRKGDGESLRCVLEIAGRAAALGVVPAATPAELRSLPERLSDRLRDAGAWHPEAPLWWEPLPERTAVERLWRMLDGRCEAPALALPSRDAIAEAFAEGRWMRLDPFLAAGWAAALHAELEAALDSLELEREGVGASGRLSARRSDAVRYLTGEEPEVVASCPRLAVLVQWCRHRLADHLAEALGDVGGGPLFPPQQAMLARYPAPSAGYAPHFDNPGGDRDNGRALTLVLYLNGPEAECRGGEIAVWSPRGDASQAPDHVAPAAGGTAILFDARAVAHQVRPVREGPARWALTLWFNDTPQAPQPIVPLPELTPTDALLGIAEPSLPEGTVLFHELDDASPAGTIVARAAAAPRPRVGLVATVYRGGAELDAWCEHHLGLGVEHVVLIFDHLEEASEAGDAERLRARFPGDRLTIWSGTATANRWPEGDPRLAGALRFARSGSSSHAVAGRQTLNASVALAAARSDELGGAPLDWLLHLDGDELLFLEGAGRGGETLHEHYAAAEASGLVLLRYLNHELLLPDHGDFPGRFKVNPRLAAARLGTRGWSQTVKALRMAQTDARPYFNGYFNGKSSVRVAAGVAAAGVHGWFLADGVDPTRGRLLAGPSVLHRHFATALAFRRKYLDIAGSPLPPGPRLFELCPAEEAALELVRSLRAAGADEETIAGRLDALHEKLTCFSTTDAEILDEAGLILRPGGGSGSDPDPAGRPGLDRASRRNC